MSEARPVSGYRLEQVLSTWHAARQRLLTEDPALAQDEAALIELLGPEEGEVEDILARLLRGALHASSMAEAAKDRMAVLGQRAARYKTREQYMRATAFALMDTLRRTKFEMFDLTASITPGRAGVVITDLEAVPDIYVEEKTTRVPDKATLLSALKSGAAVPGAELSNGMPNLTIRTH